MMTEQANVATNEIDCNGTLFNFYQYNGGPAGLAQWVKQNATEVEQMMHKQGAVLFRGFDVDDQLKFLDFANAACNKVMEDNGEHNRSNISSKVYTPVVYPERMKIYWHCENSYNDELPAKIMFCCLKPSETGGRTTIVDNRRMLDVLDPALVKLFSLKGVRYVRSYDGYYGNGWEQVFGTEDRDEVARYCKQHKMGMRWLDDDVLQTYADRPGVYDHPVTGEPCWINQILHWHISCLDEDTRESFLNIYEEDELPRHCYFGDGSEIDDGMVEEIIQAYESLEFGFDWQKGDVMLVDNILSAHARNPYSGERKLLVAMGDVHII